MHQLSLPLDLYTDEPAYENWFQDILAFLGVSKQTAWVDCFGKSLRKSIMQQGRVPIKTLSLFSGGGGLDIAFHDAGFEIIQMVELERSANKKHGNIADIELLEDRQIVEAWDAKYGKSYLRDEIEELSEKLEIHPVVRKAGFVTSIEPERIDELKSRCEEIEEIFGISLKILTFEQWVKEQFTRTLEEVVTENKLASAWITAYTESLAQQRRDIALIDEPCYQWLLTLNETLIDV